MTERTRSTKNQLPVPSRPSTGPELWYRGTGKVRENTVFPNFPVPLNALHQAAAEQIAMSRAETEGKKRGESLLLGASERCLYCCSKHTALPSLHRLHQGLHAAG
jgi:hypothetical protein